MSELLGDPGRHLYVLALCLPRIITVLLVVPFAGPGSMPVLVRACIAVSLGAFLYPAVVGQFPEDGLEGLQFAALIAKEVTLGLLIGYLFGVLFWAVECIGHLIDTHRGATLAGALMLSHGEEKSPLAAFFGQMFLVLFFIGGGLAVFLGGLYHSFVAWPILSFFPTMDMASLDFFIDRFGSVAYLGAFLAGPAVIAMFAAEMGFAITNRFVPQMQVFFLALPIKSALAMLVLTVYTFTLVQFLDNEIVQLDVMFGEMFALPL